MTPEETYDTEIAPALLAIAKRCQELGFPFAAQVEWDPTTRGQCGSTISRPSSPRPSAAQLLVEYACRCRGNVDSMIWAIMRDAKEHGHTSACLQILGVPEKPQTKC